MGWLPKYKKGDIIESRMSIDDMDDYWLTDPRASIPSKIDPNIQIKIQDISIIRRTYDITYLKHPLMLMTKNHIVKWYELETEDYKYSLSSKLKHL